MRCGFIWSIIHSKFVEALSDATKNLHVTKHKTSRIICKLPQIMTPSKQAFESIGFTFKDIGDTVTYQAELPEGWHLESCYNYLNYFIDKKGRKRGNFFYKETSNSHFCHMVLNWRFHATQERVDPFGDYIKVVVKDWDETTIYESGQCKSQDFVECQKLMGKAIKYLNDNYPDWGNPIKYWD